MVQFGASLIMRILLCAFVSASILVPALAAGQSPTEAPASTIQANTNLVVLDVVVSDALRNPVHKLTKADFTVLESGHAQTIKTFEEHASDQTIAKLPPLPKLPPGTFTNYSVTPANGALNVLLLDTLNTPMTAQADVRNQMLKYLKEAHPGTRMAIFGLSTRLVLLQGFTSDPELLRTVVNGKKGLPKGSALMNDAVNGDNPGADDPMMDAAEDAASALGNDPGAAQMVADLQQFEAETQSFQLQLRARDTLDAFNLLGRYLSGLPGRKNLIWFSGSFPINIMPDGDLQNPFGVVATSADEFRETTELLSKGQVAVYPIDARGLMVTPMMSAINSGRKYARTPGAFAKDNSTFSQQTSDDHSTMLLMAEATGGEAYMNTNGLKEAIEKAIEAGSNYYTLTYTPDRQKWNGEYRKIRVNLARKGMNLAYRRGYFAGDPSAPKRGSAPVVAVNGPAPDYSAMRAAMTRGGPDPTEITFLANVRPSVSGTEASTAPGNKPAPKTNGPYQRYTVQFGISAGDIGSAPTPDGVHHCALSAMIFVYDADGALLNSTGGGIHADIPADRYAGLLQSGIHFHQDISVPVKGEYFLRIGIHDETTNKVGAVELPIVAVSKLPPLPAPVQSPAQGPTQNKAQPAVQH
jgi:VWFA-related protein